MPPRILVVDDEKHILRLLVLALEDDFEVVTAANGTEAVRIALDLMPDIILLDVMLPGLSGLQVAENLKARPEFQDTPLVFLTAKADLGEDAAHLVSGASGFFTKPFDLETLRNSLLDLVKCGETKGLD